MRERKNQSNCVLHMTESEVSSYIVCLLCSSSSYLAFLFCSFRVWIYVYSRESEVEKFTVKKDVVIRRRSLLLFFFFCFVLLHSLLLVKTLHFCFRFVTAISFTFRLTRSENEFVELELV